MSEERGATVLEVVVALAITALLAASATQISGFGLGALERISAASARGAAAETTRRSVADAFARVAAGETAFFADGDAIAWRGALPGETGWRLAVWRLSLRDGALEACASFDAPVCEDAGAIEISRGAATFEAADGATSAEWPLGPAPHLIRIDAGGSEHVVAPRVRAFE